MKRHIYRLAYLLLCFCMLFSVPGCHTAYKVTGKIEKGDMVIWYSPRASAYYDTHIDQSLGYFDYGDEVQQIYFKSDEDFRNALQQRLITGRCPDLIIAFGDEMSPKLLSSDNFVDLNLFWDYQDTLKQGTPENDKDDLSLTSGNLKRSDILPPVLNMCKIGDKLVAMPINLELWSYIATPESDSEYGLNLMKDNITSEGTIKRITNWEQENNSSINNIINKSGIPQMPLKSIVNNTNKPLFVLPFYELPEIWTAIPNIVNYDKRKTRMKEDITYDYYCAYALANQHKKAIESAINKDNSNNSINDISKDKIMKELEYRNIGITYKYGIPPELSYVSVANIGLAGPIRNDILNYYSQNEDERPVALAFPSATSNTIYDDTHNTMIAAIPANAKRPYKAFSYIQVFLSSAYTMLESKQLMNMDILDKIFEALDLPKNIETDLRRKITGANYTWSWSDAQINEWFNALLYNKDGTLRADLPTRAEWDAVKNKVEIYLNE